MRLKNKTKDLTLIALFTVFIATGAFIRISVGPVPFTMQFFFTNLAALTLSKKNSFMCVLIYIIIGLTGIPVFTQGGGLGYILNQNFGFILGFLFGNYISSYILEKINKTNFIHYIFASIINLTVIYSTGILYYYIISHFYLNSEMLIKTFLASFMIICLPGDIISLILSSILAGRLKIIVNKY